VLDSSRDVFIDIEASQQVQPILKVRPRTPPSHQLPVVLHRLDWIPIDAEAMLQAKSIIGLTETTSLIHCQFE
jgi:hypothetical protein